MSVLQGKLKIAAGSLLLCGVLSAGMATMAQQPKPISSTTRTPQEEVLDLERAWGDALVHNDAALMDRIVAYEMVGTDPTGRRWNKAEYLESVKAGAFKIESFELAEIKVRVFADTAVSTGRSIINRRSKSGFPPGAAIFTDTYIRRNGCWQCVAWQSTAAPGEGQTIQGALPEVRESVEAAATRILQARQYVRTLEEMRKHIRNFDSDPVVKRLAGQLDDVLHEFEKLPSITKAKLSRSEEPSTPIHQELKPDARGETPGSPPIIHDPPQPRTD